MRNYDLLQPRFKAALGAVLVVGGLGITAQAQDYSVFIKTLNAPGVMSQEGPSTITFPLVRQDLPNLTINLPGTPAVPAAPENVASGYVNIQAQTAPNTYFIDGAFPALSSELSQLEAALELAGFSITAVNDQTAGTSKQIFTVHVESTMTVPSTGGAKVLAHDILVALQTIQSPQLNVLVQQPIDPIYPMIPKKYQKITNNGVYEQVDLNAIVFELPRLDVTPITIGTVVASPSVGVGQTVIISGNGASLLSVELALTTKEVQPVLEILIGGGFTISSIGEYFDNTSKKLTMVHAVAVATTQDDFQAQAEQLGQALLVTLKK